MIPVEIAKGINHALLETTIASTAALLLVLLMRRRMRAAFGATVAYAAWMLVPIASIAVLLPAPAAGTVSIPHVDTFVVEPMQAVIAGAEPGISIATWLCTAWLLGAIAVLMHFIRQQRRFRTSLGRLFVREADVLQADAVAGLPAVIGVFNPVIVLPVDFDTRYSVEQRELMLSHERAHIRHGDLQANAGFVLLRCLFWFNPLLHLAASAFRHDQELACDQRVIARHPQSRRAYGEAMFRTQLATQVLPMGCHWGFTHPLKERIEMLKTSLPSKTRRIVGASLLAMSMLLVGAAAWGTQSVGAEVSQASAGADYRMDLTISNDGKPGQHFSINNSFGQTFTVKDDDGGLIKLIGTVQPVTQHGDLFFRISTELKHAGSPDSAPTMVIGEGDTGTVNIGNRMPDGRFDGVQISMQVTPRDAAKAAAGAVTFQPGATQDAPRTLPAKGRHSR